MIDSWQSRIASTSAASSPVRRAMSTASVAIDEAFVEVGVPGALDAQEREQAGAVGAVRVAEPREGAR